jgi:hypothetical protein
MECEVIVSLTANSEAEATNIVSGMVGYACCSSGHSSICGIDKWDWPKGVDDMSCGDGPLSVHDVDLIDEH